MDYKEKLSSINNIDTIGYKNGVSGSLPTYIFLNL